MFLLVKETFYRLEYKIVIIGQGSSVYNNKIK